MPPERGFVGYPPPYPHLSAAPPGRRGGGNQNGLWPGRVVGEPVHPRNKPVGVSASLTPMKPPPPPAAERGDSPGTTSPLAFGSTASRPPEHSGHSRFLEGERPREPCSGSASASTDIPGAATPAMRLAWEGNLRFPEFKSLPGSPAARPPFRRPAPSGGRAAPRAGEKGAGRLSISISPVHVTPICIELWSFQCHYWRICPLDQSRIDGCHFATRRL